MQLTDFGKLDLSRLPSPCFVVDEVAVERNLQILNQVARDSGAKILSALKAFSMWRLAPMYSSYLDGTCASGLHEARLGRECYGGEVHVFSAAYGEDDLREILERQRQRVREELEKTEPKLEQLTLGFNEEERRQLETDGRR